MKKILSICALMLCLLFALSAALADEAAFTEKTTKVISEGKEAGTLTLRFYEDAPHVPYMGVGAYSEYMRRQPLTLRDEGDGVIALENEFGGAMLCDVNAGTILIPDWNRFFQLPMPLEDEAIGWKDTRTHFARIVDVAYEGEPAPVELDLAKYGIPMYADGNDVYLPVSTLCNIMTDVAMNYMLYNGENLYAQRMDLTGEAPEGFFDSETMQAELEGGPRPDDIIRQSYADLCFTMDHFFGHPGRAPLDEALAERGLDQALTDLGDDGEVIRAGLMSPDLGKYMSAMSRLFLVHLFDGHTLFLSDSSLMTTKPEDALKRNIDATLDLMESQMAKNQVVNEMIPGQRLDAWGEDTYHEFGSTAVIQLDSFMPDESGWASYYRGESDIPQDSLGIVITGLRRAAENPEIKNVIFDLSCNNGGSPDVMMAILALTTGQDQLQGIHKLTGQRMTFTFEADANLDGVYDEKDRDVRYDFNYGVLVTRHAFSCGNLFPFVAREGGMVVIGEPSSGGSCCVQMGSDAEGLIYMMSSAQWQLTDSDYNTVEGGCPVDIPIEPASTILGDIFANLVKLDKGLPSFKDYFDGERLDALMNEWYQSPAETKAAA